MKKKGIFISIIIIVIIAVAFFIFKQKKAEKSKEPEIKTVSVDTVKKQDITLMVRADGTVELKEKKEVFANSTGTIEKVLVKEGDKVQKGDALATYSSDAIDNLNMELREANLGLDSANLSLEQMLKPEDKTTELEKEEEEKKLREKEIKAKVKEIERQTKAIADLEESLVKKDEDIQKAKKEKEAGDVLYSEGAISLVEHKRYEETIKNEIDASEKIKENIADAKESLTELNEQHKELLEKNEPKKEKEDDKAEKENRVESQKIVVEQAKMRVDNIKEKIANFKTKIVAPISGTILKLDVSEGENMVDGKLIAEISDLSNLYIKSKIAQDQVENIEVGQSVQVIGEELPNPEKITKVSEIAEGNQIPIEISLSPETKLKAGFNVSLDITTKTLTDMPVIPVMAYLIDNGIHSVFVVDENNVITKREIILGEYDGGVVAVEGLEEGELIVSQPVEGLKDGMTINAILPEVMPGGEL